jgi:hypothetical protein
MRTITHLIVTAAIAVSPVAASAQSRSDQLAAVDNKAVPTVAVPATSAPAVVQDKKVCKSLPSSYSRKTERVCLTKEQWQQVEDESR